MLTGKTFGFIGGGNMAEAIIKGLLGSGIPASAITVAEPVEQRRNALSSQYQVTVTGDNTSTARSADLLILAVKPQVAPGVLADLSGSVTPATLVISIMAGIATTTIEQALGSGIRVLRAMPNTPALIQAAATAICCGSFATEEDLHLGGTLFSLIGHALTVPESQMDAVTGLSGSGPAYVFTFIEALADAGVKTGLPRDVAARLAVQTVLGAAAMVAHTGEHPAILREKVTSPGGTTIAGLHALETAGFRGTVMDAVEAACRRSQELSAR